MQTYFPLLGPGPDPMKSSIPNAQPQGPHILLRGIITTEEAEKLFKMCVLVYRDNHVEPGV